MDEGGNSMARKDSDHQKKSMSAMFRGRAMLAYI
jgi:hypothetical protein